MKKLFSLLLVLCLVLLSFVACDNTDGKNDDGTSTQTPDGDSTPDDPGTEEQAEAAARQAARDAAKALIAERKYEEAYAALKALGDDTEAKALLAHFRYLPLKLSYTCDSETEMYEYFYGDGNLPVKIVATYSDEDGSVSGDMLLTYDADGRLIKSEENSDPKKVSEYTYDAQGNCIKKKTASIWDEEGNYRVYENHYEYQYDERGNCIKSVYTNADGETTTYDYLYGDKGRLSSCVRVYPEGRTETDSYEYDARGNKTKETIGTSPEQETTYTYDEKGNLLTQTYSSGEWVRVITNTYDENGNLVQKTNATPYEKTTYTYTYDANGNRVKEVRTLNQSSSTKEWTYDTNGNVIREVSTLSSGAQDTVDVVYKLVYLPLGFHEDLNEMLDVYEWIRFS